MKKENKKKIITYAGIGILTATLTTGGISLLNKNNTCEQKNGNIIINNSYVPEGYHIEQSKLVKNPTYLVDSSFVLEEGYHLEPYEYDASLFYIVRDGYHNENGYLIPDGSHLEDGNKIVKDNILRLQKSNN